MSSSETGTDNDHDEDVVTVRVSNARNPRRRVSWAEEVEIHSEPAEAPAEAPAEEVAAQLEIDRHFEAVEQAQGRDAADRIAFNIFRTRFPGIQITFDQDVASSLSSSSTENSGGGDAGEDLEPSSMGDALNGSVGGNQNQDDAGSVGGGNQSSDAPALDATPNGSFVDVESGRAGNQDLHVPPLEAQASVEAVPSPLRLAGEAIETVDMRSMASSNDSSAWNQQTEATAFCAPPSKD